LSFTTFKYSVARGRFEFTAPAQISGELYVDGSGMFEDDIYLHYKGPDGDQYIFFYDDSAPDNEWLKWDEADDRFEFSNDLYVEGAGLISEISGHAYAAEGDTLDVVCGRGHETQYDIHSSGTITADVDLDAGVDVNAGGDINAGADVTAGGDAKIDGNVHVNFDAGAGDPTVFFYYS